MIEKKMEIQLFIYKKHIKYPMKYTIKETRFFDLKKSFTNPQRLFDLQSILLVLG
jgi:hypothetical protein